MINKKDLELKLLLRESHIQQLNLKVEELKQELLNERENANTYLNNINIVRKYILNNYTNSDGSIWHEAMQKIYNILEGDYNEN